MRAAVAIFVALCAAVSWAGPSEGHRYLGAKWCRSCHSRRSDNPKMRAYHAWEGSAHAQAWDDLPDDQKDNPRCLRCHTTGFGFPRRSDVDDEALRGVQCEACHGPGSDYFTWRVMKDPEKARARGLVMPGREVCTRCHW